ncbi:MAG TPA: carboxypeptidase-like regulatory domain-containing protein [Azonexus sp.]
MKHVITGAFLFCCLLSGPAAQPVDSAVTESQPGNIAYLSGGIGDEEREAIRARERDFNLKLLFAERDGAYLADVAVQVLDAKGQPVFEIPAAGPFLLLKLPPGRYQVKATANGRQQQARLSLPAKGRQDSIFRW